MTYLLKRFDISKWLRVTWHCNSLKKTKLSHCTWKPTNNLCAQWRLRSARASAQFDQSSLCAQQLLAQYCFMLTVKTDQTGRMPRLIRVFAGCTCHFVGFVLRWLKYSHSLNICLKKYHPEKLRILENCWALIMSFEPPHEIMVLITQATSEGLGKPEHLHSLARAFAVRTHEVWK